MVCFWFNYFFSQLSNICKAFVEKLKNILKNSRLIAKNACYAYMCTADDDWPLQIYYVGECGFGSAKNSRNENEKTPKVY